MPDFSDLKRKAEKTLKKVKTNIPDWGDIQEKGSNLLEALKTKGKVLGEKALSGASTVGETIKSHPEILTTPAGAGLGAYISRALQDPENRSLLKTLTGAGIGGVVGYGAGWASRPENYGTPPKKQWSDNRSALYNLLWGNRGLMGKGITAAVTLALTAAGIKKFS